MTTPTIRKACLSDLPLWYANFHFQSVWALSRLYAAEWWLRGYRRSP